MNRPTVQLEMDEQALLLHASALELEQLRLHKLERSCRAAGLPDLASDYAELVELARAQLALIRHALRKLSVSRDAH